MGLQCATSRRRYLTNTGVKIMLVLEDEAVKDDAISRVSL
jgi:hypothetical protein